MLLNDRGEGFDSTAGDEIYTGRFTATNREGTYALQIVPGGVTAAGHAFDRYAGLERYITVGLTAEDTRVTVNDLYASDNSRVLKIIVTPKNALGNFLGPGGGSSLRLSSPAGHVSSRPWIKQSITLEIPKR